MRFEGLTADCPAGIRSNWHLEDLCGPLFACQGISNPNFLRQPTMHVGGVSHKWVIQQVDICTMPITVLSGGTKLVDPA